MQPIAESPEEWGNEIRWAILWNCKKVHKKGAGGVKMKPLDADIEEVDNK